MQILLPTSLNTAALPNHLAQLASDRIHALFCLAHLISRRIDPILHQPVCNESVEEEIGEGEKVCGIERKVHEGVDVLMS